MPFRRVIWISRRVEYCSGGLYGVHGSYMLFRMVIWILLRVVYCSRKLYAVQGGFMICGCSVGKYGGKEWCK